MTAPVFSALGATLVGASGTTFNFPVPAGVAADEVVVILMYTEMNTSATITWPAGFTQLAMADNTTSGHRLYCAWKRASGADSGNYTVTFSISTNFTGGVAMRISGCVTSGDPFSIPSPAAGVTTSNQTAAPALSVTTTFADTLLLYFDSSFSQGSSWTPPTGMTEQRDGDSGLWSVNSLAKSTPGSTGSLSATYGTSASLSSILVVANSTFATQISMSESVGVADASGNQARASTELVTATDTMGDQARASIEPVGMQDAVAVDKGTGVLRPLLLEPTSGYVYAGFQLTTPVRLDAGGTVTIAAGAQMPFNDGIDNEGELIVEGSLTA